MPKLTRPRRGRRSRRRSSRPRRASTRNGEEDARLVQHVDRLDRPLGQHLLLGDEGAVDVREQKANRVGALAHLSARYRRMSAFVELSWASSGAVSLSSSGMIRFARTFPSSTPHWSKESIPQIVPWVKTLCS